jgi:hypothetical protein
MLSFLFGEGTGTASAEELARKRAIVNQLMTRDLQPQTFATGLRQFGGAVAGRMGDRRLDPKEDAERERSSSEFARIAAMLGGGMPAAPMSAMPAPVAPPPMPTPPVDAAPATGSPMPPVATSPLPPANLPPQIAAAVDRVAPPIVDGAGTAAPAGGPMGDTLAPSGTDWLRYDNANATRSLPLAAPLVDALAFLPELGVTMEVFSGGQHPAGQGPRTGSTRHDHGNAADVFFYDANGRRLDWSNPQDVPLFQEIVRRARANGVTGFGAGDNYMQPGSMHIGFGNEAVWGAGGSGSNAPDWLREAFNGATVGTPPVMASASAPSGGQFTEAGMSTMGGAPSGGNMGIVMQLAELAGNPYLPEGQRMIAQMLIQQQMGTMFAPPPSQMDQIELERAQLELEQMRNPAAEPVDLPTSVEEYNFYAEQELAAGRTPVSYGEFNVMEAEAGNPSFTEGQSKDNVYIARAEGALAVLDAPIDDGGYRSDVLTSRGNQVAGAVPFGLARGMQDPQYQVAQQAGEEFLMSILRKDTGAAITQDEQALYGDIYLPRPGDQPAVIEAKRVARVRAIEAMRAGTSALQQATIDRALIEAAERSGATANPAAPAAGGGDFSTMTEDQLGAVDVQSLSPQEFAAWEARVREVMGQ